MTARLRAGLAAATFAAAAMLACGDPNAPVASFDNYADTLELYALNGAPRAAPTAIRLIAGAVTGTAAVTTDGGFGFDVAVDIDAQGRPVLYPVRAVAAPFIGVHRVGIRRTTNAFDSVARAPVGNYAYDSLAVLTVGEVVLIETADPEACRSLFGGGVIYAKMVVDSVRAASRRIFARVTADPNCGFRSLVVPGRPAD
ncbi:MAG: hypothetical protein M3282_13455 [Gemmatimonadota bacterium]|nr:hypothetical protein [Gemmatimonadota bacterium]